MASTVRLLAVVDLEGKVMAVQLSNQNVSSTDQNGPSFQFEPLHGQRVISMDVPQEVMNLPGPDLHQFLSDIRISWPVDVQMPEMKIVKKTEHKSEKKGE